MIKLGYPYPVDFNTIRAKFAEEIFAVTGATSVLEEANYQNAKRPILPYFSFKIIVAAYKYGDDSRSYDGAMVWSSGGQRKMTVSFHCYGNSQEEAYNLMGLWQAALELANVQEDLRRTGIAVWQSGEVADVSELLNTGYEGRSHMDVDFGIAMNISSNLGEMDTVTVDGTITTEQGTDTLSVTVTGE